MLLLKCSDLTDAYFKIYNQLYRGRSTIREKYLRYLMNVVLSVDKLELSRDLIEIYDKKILSLERAYERIRKLYMSRLFMYNRTEYLFERLKSKIDRTKNIFYFIDPEKDYNILSFSLFSPKDQEHKPCILAVNFMWTDKSLSMLSIHRIANFYKRLIPDFLFLIDFTDMIEIREKLSRNLLVFQTIYIKNQDFKRLKKILKY